MRHHPLASRSFRGCSRSCANLTPPRRTKRTVETDHGFRLNPQLMTSCLISCNIVAGHVVLNNQHAAGHLCLKRSFDEPQQPPCPALWCSPRTPVGPGATQAHDDLPHMNIEDCSNGYRQRDYSSMASCIFKPLPQRLTALGRFHRIEALGIPLTRDRRRPDLQHQSLSSPNSPDATLYPCSGR